MTHLSGNVGAGVIFVEIGTSESYFQIRPHLESVSTLKHGQLRLVTQDQSLPSSIFPETVLYLTFSPAEIGGGGCRVAGVIDVVDVAAN